MRLFVRTLGTIGRHSEGRVMAETAERQEMYLLFTLQGKTGLQAFMF